MRRLQQFPDIFRFVEDFVTDAAERQQPFLPVGLQGTFRYPQHVTDILVVQPLFSNSRPLACGITPRLFFQWLPRALPARRKPSRPYLLFPCSVSFFRFPDAQKYTNGQYLVISQWHMDVSVFKVAASGATSGGNDPPPIRDRHAPIRQSPVKGNVRGRFIIPCRVSREPTFASVHGISFSPPFLSHNLFPLLFFSCRGARYGNLLSVAKVVTGLTLLQDRAAGRFAAKSSSFPAGERIFRQNLAAAIPDTLFDATETDSIHTGSATA